MKSEHVSIFRARIYAIVREIPRGMIATYKAVAARAGCKSCRAVGQALRRNPFAPQVPCHRVIASDLGPGGFCGKRSGAALMRKIGLLELEGVRFRNGRLADPGRIFRFKTKAQCKDINLVCRRVKSSR